MECGPCDTIHKTFLTRILESIIQLRAHLFALVFMQVMSNQDAVNSIKAIKDPHAAAKRLVDEALSRKSRDDISCVVVRFQ